MSVYSREVSFRCGASPASCGNHRQEAAAADAVSALLAAHISSEDQPRRCDAGAPSETSGLPIDSFSIDPLDPVDLLGERKVH